MATENELNLQVLRFELKHAKRRVLSATGALRSVCEDVDRDIERGWSHNHSNTTSATELFYAIGRYNMLLETIEMLEGKK
jgi:hypothetical protein